MTRPQRRALLALSILTTLSVAALAAGALARGRRPAVGNAAVPEPAKSVDLNRYAGFWYEIGRYENGFERGCEGATAEYRLREDGLIQVVNACRRGGPSGPLRTIQGRARVTPDSGGAKLKVSFFGPFFVGDYWVLDHDLGYEWSIVGEPSGRYLWLLSRAAHPSAVTRQVIENRVRDLGYDVDRVRPTLQ